MLTNLSNAWFSLPDLVRSTIWTLVVTIVLILCVAFTTLWERKVIGWMQLRRGPNRVHRRKHLFVHEPSVLEHVVSGLGLVDAVDLVARHVAVAPLVGSLAARDHIVGRGGDAAKFRVGQLRCAGDLAFDHVGRHWGEPFLLGR